uniref:RING finger protein 141 n=1 Tax=Corethrella appendiculata TaxID=1370023 RepID=U5EX62_9DIPT
MGQNASIPEIIPDTVDLVQFEVKKQAKIFSEISSLSYEDFLKCLSELNDLSRKCLDPQGKQLVFVVKKGTDSSLLWKGTVRIACVKIDPQTKKIDSYKLLTLKKFLQVFQVFQTNIHSMIASEQHRLNSPTSSPSRCFGGGVVGNSSGSSAANDLTASILMDHLDNISCSTSSSSGSGAEEITECCICLDRKPQVSLPCAHVYCLPCIEQWNVENKTCPICDEKLQSTDDTWELSEIPEVDEISEEICSTLMKLSKD